jgi:hypothetical protein
MQQPLDGYAATVHIVAQGRKPLSMAIRHIQLTHFLLENIQHNLLHNEQVRVRFNFVLDGRITHLKFPARIKLDSRHGIGLVFDRSSVLREVSRRLIKARPYANPCHFFATRKTAPTARIA